MGTKLRIEGVVVDAESVMLARTVDVSGTSDKALELHVARVGVIHVVLPSEGWATPSAIDAFVARLSEVVTGAVSTERLLIAMDHVVLCRTVPISGRADRALRIDFSDGTNFALSPDAGADFDRIVDAIAR